MRKRAVLFDFDLTLADSTLGVVECVNYALEAMALPRAEPQAIRATIGFSLAATLARLTGLTDPVSAQEFSRNFVKQADLRMVELTSVFPGVAQTLDRLKAGGIKTGIVSTKFRYRIETILARDGLLEAFDEIIGGEDVMHHKPDPEGLVKALGKLDVRTLTASMSAITRWMPKPRRQPGFRSPQSSPVLQRETTSNHGLQRCS